VVATHPSGCARDEAVLRPRLEVADIFRAHAADYLRAHPATRVQHKTIDAILQCRTAALGGHVDECDRCGFTRVSYNSCRNRHCPKCQALAQADWLERRKERILPVPHFHVVFTLPAELRPLALRNPGPLYDLLFQAAARSLLAFGHDPRHLGAELGITAVLHTWTRDLRYHPHLHCIVTGGGLSQDGTRWVHKGDRFLFPVRALAQVFRGKLLAGLRALYQRGALDLAGSCAALREVPAWEVLCKQLAQKNWVVYAKRPFGGAAQVYAYLGRYTHRVGLSNQRLLSLGPEAVRFKTKHGKSCTLAPLEFMRRFLLHVLPTGFVKLRHFGLLSSTGVRTRLPLAQQRLKTPTASSPSSAPAKAPAPAAAASASSLGSPASTSPLPRKASFRDKLKALTGIDLDACPRCRGGRMLHRLTVGLRRPMTSPRGPAATMHGAQTFADSS
jgi:hypothetical protein